MTNEHIFSKEEFDQIQIPKPLLSICVITTQEDKEKYGKLFLSNLPKSSEIELILVTTKKSDTDALIVDVPQLRLQTAEYYYSTPLFDFSAARNFAKSLATGTWILSLDMDEIIGKHSHQNLLIAIKEYVEDESVLGFRLGVISSGWDYTLEKYVRVTSAPVRIFRNIDTLKWTGKLHEVVLIDDKNLLDTPFIIEHFGYAISLEDSIKKFERNLRGIAWEITENTDRLDHFLLYMKKTIDAYQRLLEIKNKQGN